MSPLDDPALWADDPALPVAAPVLPVDDFELPVANPGPVLIARLPLANRPIANYMPTG